jgi:hypothetical protein
MSCGLSSTTPSRIGKLFYAPCLFPSKTVFPPEVELASQFGPFLPNSVTRLNKFSLTKGCQGYVNGSERLAQKAMPGVAWSTFLN